MRFHWIILTGIIAGFIESIPYWEIYDPQKALPERRILFLAQFASYTVLPFAAGFVAGRDYGGSVRHRMAAGAATGLVIVVAVTCLLCVIPSWIQSTMRVHWGLALFFLTTFNIGSSTAGGLVSSVFKGRPPVR